MQNSHAILGVITARGGSKGITGKNVKVLGGKPLISYTLEAAKKSKLITHLIVSTDNEEIAEIARKATVEVPFMRPADLSEDNTPHAPVMVHAVTAMEGKLGIKFDYAVVLQPTSPFRMPEDIDLTLKKLIESGADSAVTLVDVGDFHPIKAKRLEGDRVVPFCVPEVEGVRRQDLPKAYRRSGSVYATKRDLLVGQGKLYGDYIVGHIVPEDRSVDINDSVDWMRAEVMLIDLKKKGYEF